MNKNKKNLETKIFNVFLIRETYVYMAKIDKIKNATKRLYDHLGVNADYYNQMVHTGSGDIRRIEGKLVECGL